MGRTGQCRAHAGPHGRVKNRTLLCWVDDTKPHVSDSGGGSCHYPHAEYGSVLDNCREPLYTHLNLWCKEGEGIGGGREAGKNEYLCGLAAPVPDVQRRNEVCLLPIT